MTYIKVTKKNGLEIIRKPKPQKEPKVIHTVRFKDHLMKV